MSYFSIQGVGTCNSSAHDYAQNNLSDQPAVVHDTHLRMNLCKQLYEEQIQMK